ncbi:MAG TPA: preprotein translocase subunit YajC [Bacteroidales bacterium]|nr:preprotein translocase subunit YajC [Bacteroidales bacterium]
MNSTILSSILLFAPQNQEGGGGGFGSLFVLVAIMVIFYLFFIRPQMKRSKEQKKFRENLKKGDKVVTIGGLHGKIAEVQETTFTLELADNVKIRIDKSAVAMDSQSQIGEQK